MDVMKVYPFSSTEHVVCTDWTELDSGAGVPVPLRKTTAATPDSWLHRFSHAMDNVPTESFTQIILDIQGHIAVDTAKNTHQNVHQFATNLRNRSADSLLPM